MNYQLITHQEVLNYSQATGMEMGWPAIIAETEEGEVKGIMATEPREDVVIAGPIVASSSIVALRLIEKYEDVLKKMNITTYLFNIDKHLDKWVQAIRKADVTTVVEETDTHWWFRRNL